MCSTRRQSWTRLQGCQTPHETLPIFFRFLGPGCFNTGPPPELDAHILRLHNIGETRQSRVHLLK